MKAIVHEKYGSPDVLQLAEIEKPVPAAGDVLVKVHAAAANPLDWHLMRASPFFTRFESGLLKPRNPGLGADLAGQVEAVGSDVTRFKPGDKVFGDCSQRALGAFAEYVCVPEKTLVHKPDNITFEEAAAVPVAGITAWQGLRTGQVEQRQKVLINGASGGVGTFAVQIARSSGCHVTGVCSTRNLELVRSIGADAVVDYTQVDFTQNGQQYDLIFDAVGNRSVSDIQRALTPDGACVIAGFTGMSRLFDHILRGAWVSWRSSRSIGLMPTAHATTEDLQALADLLATGKIKPVIDRHYPLNETADAIRYLEEGHARGKVIILVEPEHAASH